MSNFKIKAENEREFEHILNLECGENIEGWHEENNIIIITTKNWKEIPIGFKNEQGEFFFTIPEDLKLSEIEKLKKEITYYQIDIENIANELIEKLEKLNEAIDNFKNLNKNGNK